ncbi:MAG: hypothetical protein QXR88_01215 [Candidatus Pacearchaeota archaeon]
MIAGGCMNSAYNAGNIFAKDNYCEAYKMVFEHLGNLLWKKGNVKYY